jgi:large subunit ribosomal protein L10
MTKQEKTAEIEAIRSALQGGHAAFVLAPKGLTVNQVSTLRRKIRASHGSYRVLKNRLALRAIADSPYAPLAPHLKGESALAYGAADPAPLAKAIEEFSKDNQGLTVKAGIVDGRLIGALQVRAVLQGPARGLVRALDEIAKKKDAGATEAGTTETPAS